MRKPDTFTVLGGLLIFAAAGSYLSSRLVRERTAPIPRPTERSETADPRGFDPLSPSAHWTLAERLEKAGQLEEAERVKRAARRLGGENVPEPPSAAVGAPAETEVLELPLVDGAEAVAATMAIAAKGDLDGALDAVRKLIEKDGENHLNQTALGFILSYRAEAAEAEKALSRAMELNAEFAPAIFGRGVVRLRSRRFRDAVPDLEEACRLVPGMLPWRIELAKALLGVSRTDEALKQLEHALRGRPAVPEVYRLVGDCLLRGGREQEARRWYRATILLGGPDAVPEGVRKFAEGVVTEGVVTEGS